ncbi:MAG TPA: DNA-formamidopyrimidine glycosylase family protein, partial [Candidatus Eisenbacteria bacterium]
VSTLSGKQVGSVSRIGKRLVWHLEDDLHVVIHPMVAGRFHLRKPDAAVPRKNTLAVFDLPADDTRPAARLLLTEASTKKRATMSLVRGQEALEAFRAGGLDVMTATDAEFSAALRRENHTIKRSLTDPRLFDGIGNAYSDEILHRARMSPMKLTRRLTDPEIARLAAATRETLSLWIHRHRQKAGDKFPEKVTAFHDDMAVHGKFGKPCPDCGTPVQRIVYAENECNYCAVCQNDGRLLADRALSRLLRADWPRTLEDLEALRRGAGTGPK